MLQLAKNLSVVILLKFTDMLLCSNIGLVLAGNDPLGSRNWIYVTVMSHGRIDVDPTWIQHCVSGGMLMNQLLNLQVPHFANPTLDSVSYFRIMCLNEQ